MLGDVDTYACVYVRLYVMLGDVDMYACVYVSLASETVCHAR